MTEPNVAALLASRAKALADNLDSKGLCPDCACEKAKHGTFGWTGCSRRFTVAALVALDREVKEAQRDYNAAIANGLVARARSIGRRLDALKRLQANDSGQVGEQHG